MDIVKDLISNYGYFAIYGLLAIGIIGLPVPDEFMMTFVGYLSSISVLKCPGSIPCQFPWLDIRDACQLFHRKKGGEAFFEEAW